MVPPEYLSLTVQVDRERNEVVNLKRQLARLRRAQEGAPKDLGWWDWMLLRSDVKAYDKKSADAQASLARQEALVASGVSRLNEYLRDRLGIEMEFRDVENLMSRVDGQDALRSLVNTILLRHILDSLADVAERTKFDASTFLEFLDTKIFLDGLVLENMRKHLYKYDSVWLPEILKI
jgi:hypothetical protein